MASFSVKDVSALRARTGAGMMDCKKALEETGGDLEKAVDLLRQKGIARAEGPYIAWFTDPAGNILSVLQER